MFLSKVMNLKYTFATRINRARLMNGFTIEKLAKSVDIKKSGISAMEAGERVPRTKTFIRLCNALAVTPDYLLQDTNKMTAVFAIEHHLKSIDITRANNAIIRMKCILEKEGG